MRHRLLGLEAGRFVAALLVACFHFTLAFVNLRHDRIFDMAFRAGHAGVEYFFVLSGFIIYYIHRGDIGHPDRLRGFALKRFIRLYPMYWLVFLAMLAAFLLHPDLQAKRAISAGNLVLDGLLLPKSGDSIVLQSWSLRHEIVFYALFGFAILNRRLGVPALVLWQGACLIVGLIYPDSLPLAIKPFFYLYNVGFGLGIGAAWASERWHPRHPGIVAAIGALSFVTCMFVEWKISHDVVDAHLPLGLIASPLLYLGSATLLVFGLTQYEKQRPLPGAPALKILGGCSYLLYLVHAPLGSVLIRVFHMSVLARIPDPLVFVAMIAITVVASILGHLYVEKPLLALLRNRLLLPRGQPPFHGEPALGSTSE